MDSDDFRQWSHTAADWGADYRDDAARAAGAAAIEPGDIFSADRGLAARRRPSRWKRSSPISRTTIVPGMTHWQHPRFFAYFPANAAPVSVVAEYLVSAMAAQCMLWQTSPAATELETRVVDWMRQALGLPEGLFRRHPGFGLVGDACRRADHARARARLARQQAGPGRAGEAARLFLRSGPHLDRPRDLGRRASARTISSAFPAPAAFAPWIRRRWKRQSSPTAQPACCRPASSPASAAPAPAAPTISRRSRAVAQRHGLYLHVDAAWAGSAMICPEFRHFWAGVEAGRFDRLQSAQMAGRAVRLLDPVRARAGRAWCGRWRSSRNI